MLDCDELGQIVGDYLRSTGKIDRTERIVKANFRKLLISGQIEATFTIK